MSPQPPTENTVLSTPVQLLWRVPSGPQSAIKLEFRKKTGSARWAMTQDNDQTAMEEVVLPEHLLPLGPVLGPGVTALDLCLVLAKIFRVQSTEVAPLRLERGLLRFLYPEHLSTTEDIRLSSKTNTSQTQLSK